MTQSSEPALELRGVHKSFGAVRAVRGVDLTILNGSTIALLGPNGAGKSTTIAMVMGLITPDAGSITVRGLTPRAAVAAGTIAAMLQDAGLMPGVTVAELLGLANRLYPHPLPVAEALELAGLSTVARRRVDRLSGGQAQRLRFALVAVGRPDVLILDEPTRALDVAGRREFWRAMRDYAAAGRTVLFATHYLDEVDENADRVVVLRGGTVVADATPAQLRQANGVNLIRFSLDPTTAALPALPGVTGADVAGDRVVLRSSDPDATVRALSASGLAWRDLSVALASLDDSFLSLTEDNLTDSTGALEAVR
jgi:ABC-2 type transport system ATP-binding protein